MIENYLTEVFGNNHFKKTSDGYIIFYETPEYVINYKINYDAPYDIDFLKMIKSKMNQELSLHYFLKTINDCKTRINMNPYIQKGKEIILCNPCDYNVIMKKYEQVLYNNKINKNKNSFQRLIEILLEDN